MTHNVLIIGGGVAGLSAALALLERGHSVAVFDRGEIGAESSWAGGGILSPLLPWDYSESFLKLALRSMAMYEDWINETETRSGRRSEFWRCGMDVLQPENVEAVLAWCDDRGFAAQLDPESGRLRLPEVAQVRNPRLLAALRVAVQQMGGTIYADCAVERLVCQGRRANEMVTARGPVAATRFVLAAGAWSGLALPGLPAVPNVRPIRGQMLLFKLAPGTLETILYRNGLYLIPRRDGHVLVGSTVEDVGFDKSTDAATATRLHAAAADLLPALEHVQAIRHWAGLRPGSPDNIPIIDRHPDYDNVFVNTGHYRYGVTLAPAAAELLVDLMEGEAPTLDPAPYRWEAAVERKWSSTL